MERVGACEVDNNYSDNVGDERDGGNIDNRFVDELFCMADNDD